jgi:hypothetical protein
LERTAAWQSSSLQEARASFAVIAGQEGAHISVVAERESEKFQEIARKVRKMLEAADIYTHFASLS